MKLKMHLYANIGGQQSNEDSLDFFLDEDKGIFLLADGLGGHGNGKIASKLVVQSILLEFQEQPFREIQELRDSFYRANLLLTAMQKEMNKPGMLTTVTGLVIYEDKAFWGHLGDSRLYYFKDNEIEESTKDHSVSYKKYIAGDITYHEINTDEDRSSLLNVMGNLERYSPEFLTIPRTVKKGDAFLLCSDGFWEYVYDEEMLIDFLKADTPKNWVEFMLLRHIRRVKQVNDNLSLIAIYIDE